MKHAILIILIAVSLSLAATGCITYNEPNYPANPEVAYVTQTPEIVYVTQMPEPTPVRTPAPIPVVTQTPTPERELITQYIMMHEDSLSRCCEYDRNNTTHSICIGWESLDPEDVIDHLMEYMECYDLEPVEIWRSSLILHNPGYGYLYPSNYERFFTRESDYNKDYSYPPLCHVDESVYHLEWVNLGGSIRYHDKAGCSGQFYATRDIDDLRSFIEATMG